MKFKDYKYIRPEYEIIKNQFDSLLYKINISQDFDEVLVNINEINEIRNDFTTMRKLATIRFSINTNDVFYMKENEYFDKNWPYFDELNIEFYKALINSKFLPELEEKYGKQFFEVIKCMLKSFDTSIVEEIQEENRLVSEIAKVRSSAKLWFDGEYRNLTQLEKYLGVSDKKIRDIACETYFGYYEVNQDKFDNIYHQLVQVRDKKAKKLGYKNYIELGYLKMKRIDYDCDMVKSFRNYVLKYVVPAVEKLIERQKKRIGINDLQYCDESFKFISGNALPKGTSKHILKNGTKMFNELSKETGEFFNFMMDNELLDVLTREGKRGGGSCIYLPSYRVPFIFSNLNGTTEDIRVLTHEAGHAFQKYLAKEIEMPEGVVATLEAGETHSTSMEMFTMPFMEYFFEEDSKKYEFSYLQRALEVICYITLVDEFQHKVYENPDATSLQRRKIWRELEKTYLPYRKYDNNKFLDSGTWWFKQGHIFSSPFYYIDYALAQVVALQFWMKMNKNYDEAWSDYVHMCKLGGTKSFLELLKEANIKSPFEEECIKEIVEGVEDYLNLIDDRNL